MSQDEVYCHRCGKRMIDTCPECHQPVETYSRPCGYLRPVSTYNDGKQQEFADRKTFILNHGDHDDA